MSNLRLVIVLAGAVALAPASGGRADGRDATDVTSARAALAAAQAREKAAPSKQNELAIERAQAALAALLGEGPAPLPETVTAESEPNDTSATANPAIFGSYPSAALDASINPGADVDFYKFNVPAGYKVWVEMDTGGVQNAGATSRDTVIDLLDTDGTTVIENDDDDGTGNGSDGTVETGLASLIAGRQVVSGGLKYIRTRAFSATGIVNPYTASFALTNPALDTAEVETNDTAAAANALASPLGVRTGAIGVAADADYYSVVASTGDTIFFVADADPERDGTGTDLVVEFRDPADALLLSVDSSITGSLVNPAAEGGRYQVPSDGTYFIKVRHFSATGTGTYHLMAARNAATSATAPLIISEFRVRGPSGANDEFVEIRNNSNAAVTVAAASGQGFGVAASDATVRCTIPNGTVIPARGHYLCTNSVSYSLGGYATGDATFTTDIPDNAGIALFNTNVPAHFNLATRLDAVGSTSEANTLYKEGTGYPALTPFSIDYAFTRDACGKQGSITTSGPCPNGGQALDTGNNAVDFYFVDTNGTSAGAGQRLGAPGPENLASPTYDGAPLTVGPIDSCVAANLPPNTVRDFTSNPGQNSTFGTLSIRRKITNNTGANITRLRYRVVDLTTFPAPSGIADLRPRTSSLVVVPVSNLPCGTGTSNISVQGTTLEQPPSQPNGGGFNSTLSSGTITLGTPLANGASVNAHFLLGIQQTGNYKFSVNLEALPVGGGALMEIGGCGTGLTEGEAPDAGCVLTLAKGDFNGDGLPDIVFRNVANGAQNKVWFMDAATRLSETPIVPDASSTNLLIRGADDFDTAGTPGSGPDGQTDLVFWNQATGAVEFWLMNGVNRVGAAVALTGAAPLATNWSLSATADFNHNGRPDIVWRNLTSQNIVIWTMNGTAKVGNIIPTPAQAVNANWTIVAAADYDDDANTDFLWYNSTSGKIVTWYMDHSVVRSAGQFTSPDAAGDNNWQVVASADYSHFQFAPFGASDILWRNATSGNQVVWHMDFNSSRVSGQFTTPTANTPALSWVVVGPR